MFYCDPCGREYGWPTDLMYQSYGKCECCATVGACNDVSSKTLTAIEERRERAEAIESIKQAFKED